MGEVIRFDLGEAVLSPAPVLTISAYQAEVFLTEIGLFDQFIALIDDPETPARVKIAWRRGLDIRRDNPMVSLMISKLELSEEQVDEMFLIAKEIEAGAL